MPCMDQLLEYDVHHSMRMFEPASPDRCCFSNTWIQWPRPLLLVVAACGASCVTRAGLIPQQQHVMPCYSHAWMETFTKQV